MAILTTKKQSLREQSAWLLIAKVIGFGLSFFIPLLIVRYLSKDEVGYYRESFQIITNAVVILPLGFSMSAYYFLARETERRGAAIFNILIFNFVIGGMACLALYLFPQLVGNLFHSDELTALTPKIGIVVWLWIFSTFLETVAIANQEARVATAFIILAQLSKTILMGGAVIVFASVESFIYAAMVQGVIQIFVLLNYLRSRFPGFWHGFDRAFFREQMVYAIPFGLTAILWIAQNDIHNYFVGYKFSPSEFAIYAYGCFEVPLIAMLAESVASVLIPRMNALQAVGDREEMIRLTARAMQKLSFFYFPIYIFLLITAQTFIVTLFTQKYEASVPIFVINLTFLPFSILITDPIARSFKELGRSFLLTRVIILTCLIGVLWFGLGSFGLIGMITAAVAAVIVEKCVAEIIIIRKLGVRTHHLALLSNVLKTAIASVFAGVVTYVAYVNLKEVVMRFGQEMASSGFSATNSNTLNFFGGALVLLAAASVFTPIYLIISNFLGVIEDDEKRSIRRVFRRFSPKALATASIVDNN